MIYWIWLTQVNGLGPVKQKNLLKKFNSPRNIYQSSEDELIMCKGIGSKLADRIISNKSLNKANNILKKTRENNIKILTIKDPLYPDKVKEINKAPILLYYKGKLTTDSMGVAVIGARRCSKYGKKVAKEVASYLALNNITVISGMAKGIDSYAHTACLKKGGLTIAMLGNGLDICYPCEHQKLMDEIIANGAIISEYPPGTRPKSCYFPRRNLLICAWAHKILVIEAGAKSGCLITAKYGKKYGRKILAVPNNIYQSESAGSNRLIHKGAGIFLNKGQLLLEQDDKNNENDFKEVTNSQQCLNKDKIIDNDLDNTSRKIIEILNEGNKKSLEELIYLTETDRMKLIEKLSLMELKGIVNINGSICKLA